MLELCREDVGISFSYSCIGSEKKISCEDMTTSILPKISESVCPILRKNYRSGRAQVRGRSKDEDCVPDSGLSVYRVYILNCRYF